MNKGILGFPRNSVLQANSLTAQTVSASQRIGVPGSSATNTGIKLIDDSDLGSLFRPVSYTGVQTVSTSHSGGFGNANCSNAISASVTGNQLNISMSANCNCNCVCACSTDSSN
jgi:hypothetical protein